MKDKVLCCPVCETDLLLEQRPVAKNSNWVDGFCLRCLCWKKLSKAIWKGYK